MAVRRVLQLGVAEDAERLRRRSVKVKRIDAGVKRLIADLLDTFHDNAAYGLAAPQIGEFYRVVVVALGEKREPLVVVNPEIVKAAPEELKDFDGCLSIPHIYAHTRRSAAIVVKGRDGEGRELKWKLEGFDARIVQHEVDHLDGVLFIDRLDDLGDLYTYKTVSPAEGESEPELEETDLAPEQLALIKRHQRTLPAWALRW